MVSKRDLYVHINALNAIYKEHGINHETFFIQVEKLIILVQKRYMGMVVEDVQQSSYKRLVEALPYYDPTRTNIATWVYSIARHQVSSYLYHKKKRDRESEDSLPLIECPNSNQDHDAYVSRDYLEQFLEMHHRIMIEYLGEDDVHIVMTDLPDIHPIKKAYQWECLSLASKLAKTHQR